MSDKSPSMKSNATSRFLRGLLGFVLLLLVGAASFFGLQHPEILRTDGLGFLVTHGKGQIRRAGAMHWGTVSPTRVFEGDLIWFGSHAHGTIQTPGGEHLELKSGIIYRVTSVEVGNRRTTRLQKLKEADLSSATHGGHQEGKGHAEAHHGEGDHEAPTEHAEIVGPHTTDMVVLTSLLEELRTHTRITDRLRSMLARPIEVSYVVKTSMPHLTQFGAFDDYSVFNLNPPVGAVFRAQKESPTDCIEFHWTPVPSRKPSYTVEIGKTREFKFFRPFEVSGNRLRLKTSTEGDYFWRVRASQGNLSITGTVSRLTVTKPALSPEERKKLARMSQIRDLSAAIGDWDFCN